MGDSQQNIDQGQKPARLGDGALDMGFGSGESFALLQRVATMLASSTIVPATFQNNVANCVIALNLASRMRADPLMVMQSLYIVHGKPAWSAIFLIATANQSGKFSAIRYEWQGKKGEPDWGCRAWAMEKVTGERLDGSWVTWQLANDEGWVNKNGSKWRTMASQMFMYRAASFWVKVYCPEISMGLPTSEEMVDTYDAELAADGTYVIKDSEWKEEDKSPPDPDAPLPTNGPAAAQALVDRLAKQARPVPESAPAQQTEPPAT